MFKEWRKRLWDWSTATHGRTHLAHLLLVALGSLIPALLAHWVWGNLALTVVVGNVMAELWMYFMGGREVADYIGHKARDHNMDETWMDGLGDLAGPLFVRAAWWAALLTLLFGGG